MKILFLNTFEFLFVLLLCPLLALADVKVTNVTVKPRWPWNGLVDITYNIQCDEKDESGKPKDVHVVFTGYDDTHAQKVIMSSLTGDGARNAVKKGGPYTVTWNAGKDYPNFNSALFQIKIHAIAASSYLIVNLSDGTHRYSDAPPNLNNDICRTTELWLRAIPPGSFIMGAPRQEVGYDSRDDEIQHEVTLTKLYYIGVFECTQRQWELIMGNKPSYFNNAAYYATRPVEQICNNDIRGTSSTAGAGWPAYGHAVDASSFMGKLRTKTGLLFDLPTEAQWEYACRAGTTSAINSGKELSNPNGKDANMDEVGRYWYNGGSGSFQTCEPTYGTAKVGSYIPNNWGLYDMHGNVWEFCLDWYGDYGTNALEDPKGKNSGTHRIMRGGGQGLQNDDFGKAWNARSANRGTCTPTSTATYFGFRIVYLPFEN